MTAYIDIPDADVAAERPITTGLMTKLRDNPKAIAEGDPSAPSINPAALTIGGKGGDGLLDNSTPAITAMGYYEFEGMAISASRSLPPATIIRITVPDGDTAVLSDVITVSCLSRTLATHAAQRTQIADWLGGFAGSDGSGGSEGGGGGGAGAGASSFSGVGGAAKSPASLERAWVTRRPFIGGNGGLTGPFAGGSAGLEWGPGGGCLILVVEGDLDATGGTIEVDGGHTDNGGAGGAQPGGGGAGMLLVICTGEITGGTFAARGGDADHGPHLGSGGGGGGGYVQLIATAYNGTQTMLVTGGTSLGTAGGAGVSSALTLTRDQIRTLLQRL